MKAIDFANAMNNLPDELILEADPDTAGAGQGGRRTDKDKAGRAASVFSSPWFAVAAGLVVGFVAVALIVRAGRSNPGNPPIPPADSPTISSVAETDTTDGAPQTDTEPETDAQAQSIPVTVSVTPLRLTEGCTEITVRITHTKQFEKLLLTPAFRLTRIMAFDADERLSQVSQDVPVINEAVSYEILPAEPNGYASLTVTIHTAVGLTPGEYRLALADGADCCDETVQPICTFTVGFANDSDDWQCAYCRSSRFTVSAVSDAIHPAEYGQGAWLYYPEYDVFEMADSANFQENVYTRLTSPCISREGSVIITNDMPRDTELKSLFVINVGTGETVLTGSNEPGGFPRTLAPGQSLTLTSLGTLPEGTYAVCLFNIDNVEYIKAHERWSRADYMLVFYVIVP